MGHIYSVQTKPFQAIALFASTELVTCQSWRFHPESPEKAMREVGEEVFPLPHILVSSSTIVITVPTRWNERRNAPADFDGASRHREIGPGALDLQGWYTDVILRRRGKIKLV
jgi:hypothetical protein